jgi:hypothetical protein
MSELTGERYFLMKGNGHQAANKKKALDFVVDHLEGVTEVDERTVYFPPYGTCHFAAYTDPLGAMISTPDRDDNDYGSGDWHGRDNIMMFRDFGDGRCIIYVCPIEPLFGLRTIGYHGVKWPDVLKTATFTKVFKTSERA